ncbi:MAG: hypothetical protein HQL07_07350 [Nitrospirae bacterium]|nr:hypothetical protein [Magnetococcales bacterium]
MAALYEKIYTKYVPADSQNTGVPSPALLKSLLDSSDHFSQDADRGIYAGVPLSAFPDESISQLVRSFLLDEETSPISDRQLTLKELDEELRDGSKSKAFAPIVYGVRLGIGQMLDWFASLRPEELVGEDIEYFVKVIENIKGVCECLIADDRGILSLVECLELALPEHKILDNVRKQLSSFYPDKRKLAKVDKKEMDPRINICSLELAGITHSQKSLGLLGNNRNCVSLRTCGGTKGNQYGLVILHTGDNLVKAVDLGVQKKTIPKLRRSRPSGEVGTDPKGFGFVEESCKVGGTQMDGPFFGNFGADKTFNITSTGKVVNATSTAKIANPGSAVNTSINLYRSAFLN